MFHGDIETLPMGSQQRLRFHNVKILEKIAEAVLVIYLQYSLTKRRLRCRLLIFIKYRVVAPYILSSVVK